MPHRLEQGAIAAISVAALALVTVALVSSNPAQADRRLGGEVVSSTSDVPVNDDLRFGFILAVGGTGGEDCPADLNNDGVVGPADLANVLDNWGPNPGIPADINGDGEVGPADLAALLDSWGPCPGA